MKLRKSDPNPRSWSLGRDGITQSLLGDFALCSERTRLRYSEMLSYNRPHYARDLGSFIHSALELMYSNGSTVKAVVDHLYDQSIEQLTLNSAPPEALQDLENIAGVATSLLLHYQSRYRRDWEDVTWVEVESKFEFEYRGIKFTGKRDGIYRSKDSGRLWLFETKVKGRIDEDLIQDKLPFDLQVMLYSMSIMEEFGQVPAGVRYNVIRSPQLRMKKQENRAAFSARITADIKDRPDFYFMRYEAVLTKDDINEWRTEFDQLIDRFKTWNVQGQPRLRNSSACNAYGRTCDFLSICGRNDRSKFARRDIVFPELEEE